MDDDKVSPVPACTPAAQAWAALVEQRLGRRLTPYEAQRQIDALAKYFDDLAAMDKEAKKNTKSK